MAKEEFLEPSSPLFNTERVEHRRAFLINLLYIAVILGALFLAVRTLFVWMLPFVFALLVALALQRPVKWLNHKTRLSKKGVFRRLCGADHSADCRAGGSGLGWKLIRAWRPILATRRISV